MNNWSSLALALPVKIPERYIQLLQTSSSYKYQKWQTWILQHGHDMRSIRARANSVSCNYTFSCQFVQQSREKLSVVVQASGSKNAVHLVPERLLGLLQLVPKTVPKTVPSYLVRELMLYSGRRRIKGSVKNALYCQGQNLKRLI